ncbi:uncharacterized protein LOC143213641 [Lasioglossum baleicum]|uniref:uncharacterized protein LOC143213641 n=1 Tax=Lasioglossum baleicum TaxID=434251 RepID=UPI003FCD1485
MADFHRQAMLQRTILRTVENFRKIGKANLTISKVQARLSSLENAWTAFSDGHVQLLTNVPEEDHPTVSYFADDHFQTTEDTYISSRDVLLDALDNLGSHVSPTLHSPDNSSTSLLKPSVALAHLPRVPLAPFSGDPNEWESFRDRFKSLIMSNRELTDFMRMHYLVLSLTGPALEALGNIPITADNFSTAWRTLTTRFESKRRLIKMHLSNLIDLPAVERESAVDLHSLIDRANVANTSLSKLDRSPEELWTDMLVLLVSRKLDPVTSKAWCIASSQSDTPKSFTELTTFLFARARALDEMSVEPCDSVTSKTTSCPRVHAVTTSQSSERPSASSELRRRSDNTGKTNTPFSQSSCPLCHSRHFLSSCPQYLAESPEKRREIVNRLSRCYNCLSERHAVSDCSSKFKCRVCQQTHHSSLHDASTSRANLVDPSAPRSSPPLPGCSTVVSLSAMTPRRPPSLVLLATARLKIRASSGRTTIVRALLDQGSEVTLVTENLAQLLRAKKTRRNVTISAVGGAHVETVRSSVEIHVSPVHSTTPSLVTTALVMPTLTAYNAQCTADPSSFQHLRDLQWADPVPTNSESIQMILGADLYGDVILDGIRKGRQGQPIAQNSIFGWVISGPIPSSSVDRDGSSTTNSSFSCVEVSSCKKNRSSSIAFSHHCSSSLESELRRFWEVEELPRCSPLSSTERQCEEHFMTTHSRNPDGRFVVRLPFTRDPPLEIGHSRHSAGRILFALTNKFRKDTELEREYCDFMREYEALGHMRRVTAELPPATQAVYIPHHPVFRPGSATSHLRVVFNASSLTSNGHSLNDLLLAGPKLQTDLPSVILKWRHHRYVYSADVAKMYRQILVDSRDVNFQRILWLDTITKSPIDHVLLTVTYGMTCAPFIALRVIQRLRELEGANFPLAVPILRDQIYVDDVLFGGDSVELVRARRDQVVGLLRRGKFELRKWSSNCTELLSDIDPSDHGLACTRSLAVDDHVKVLGIGWNPLDDAFQIQLNIPTTVPETKRAILSAISKIYDPLGWVTPVTITAKILLQDLWRLRVSWDEALQNEIRVRWNSVYTGLESLKALSLPRWTGLDSSSGPVELHGFCDASSHAYAAVVYLKTTSKSGVVNVSLLASKSKVAPISPLTIPRLELSAALLLARLLEFVRNSLNGRPHSCFCWGDSTIVLAWLRDSPSRWKTFVAHRVHEIQIRAPDVVWRYVPSEDNPADCASRGILGGELAAHSLWWSGPYWLGSSEEQWPSEPTSVTPIDLVCREEKAAVSVATVTSEPWDLSSRYSSWPKLLRVTGYLFKFLRACRPRRSRSLAPSTPGRTLSAENCAAARIFWINCIQRDCFPSEVDALRQRRSLSPKSSLLALDPFVDDDGILRVGGRLRHAPVAFSVKHPIILASHPLVKQIIEHAHLRALHAGLQLTLHTLRQTFWILRARSLVKSTIHACVVCVRERAAVPAQLMGQLPTPRVSPSSRCFSHCGVDYAGPFQIRASSGRGITSRKAYVSLFVCLATKAIHLELVSDYSTPAFIRAFDRFCSRRGIPCAMYSDNGTTFVGADRELCRMYRATLRNPDFLNKTASDCIVWHFIPPSAPHFGGLWEAGVKSLKHHLRRVVGARTFTFEEFSTLLCSIECCLNSRPLAPLRDSVDDFDVLTPGHFIIGSPLTAPPQPSVLELSENRLTRWQLVRSVTEHFWKRWVNDYLNTLQQRSKWRREQPSIEPGQLVLIRNSALPPCKWELGRVKTVHPGADGRVRVVTVKTSSTELTRPIVKLCPLPIVSAST